MKVQTLYPLRACLRPRVRLGTHIATRACARDVLNVRCFTMLHKPLPLCPAPSRSGDRG